MTVRNSRRYSVPHAIIVGVGAAAAFFVSACFDFGDGSFVAGLTSSSMRGFLLPYCLAIPVVTTVATGLALVAGRWLGTTLTLAVSFALLLLLVGGTYHDSQPLNRFRQLVWANAPTSVALTGHESYPSFNDGTTHVFILACDEPMLETLCRERGLEGPNERLPDTELRMMRRRFYEREVSAGAVFYAGGNIELAYFPAEEEALIMVSP